MPPGTLLGRILEALTSGYAGDALGVRYLPPELIPLGDARYVRHWSPLSGNWPAASRLSSGDGAASSFLKEYPGSLHVLVVAPLEVRVERVMQDLKLDREAACQEIALFDTSRHEFIRADIQAELEDLLQYDLVINTGRLSFDAAASNITNAFRSRGRTGRRKSRA